MMGNIKIGTMPFTDIKIGNTSISKIMIGTTLLWNSEINSEESIQQKSTDMETISVD